MLLIPHHRMSAPAPVQERIILREYELLTETHAQLSVVLNCSRFCFPVYCLPSPTPY